MFESFETFGMTGIGLTAGTAGTTLESWLLPLPPNGTVGEIWDRAWSSSLIGMLIFTCRFTLGTGCPIADMPTSAWQAALSGMLGLDGMAHAIQRNPGTSLPGGLRIFRLWADRLRQTQTQHIHATHPTLSPLCFRQEMSQPVVRLEINDLLHAAPNALEGFDQSTHQGTWGGRSPSKASLPVASASKALGSPGTTTMRYGLALAEALTKSLPNEHTMMNLKLCH